MVSWYVAYVLLLLLLLLSSLLLLNPGYVKRNFESLSIDVAVKYTAVFYSVSFWKCKAVLCTADVNAFHFTNMRGTLDRLGHISCTYVDCKRRPSIYTWDPPYNVGSLHDTVYWCMLWLGVWHRVVWLVSSHSFILQLVLRQVHRPLPKRVLHGVRSSASSFNFRYSIISLMSSSSWLCLLPRLAVTVSFSLHLLQ